MLRHMLKRKPELNRAFTNAKLAFSNHHTSDVQTFVTQNDLHRFIVQKIRSTGPLTLAEFMRLAVSAPEIGYYSQLNADSFKPGTSSDFYTAPEISQLLGELVGIWITYHVAGSMHHKGPWNLIELGPGSGQFLLDMAKVIQASGRRFDPVLPSPTVNLVEISTALRKTQANLLLHKFDLASDATISEPCLDQIYPGQHGMDYIWRATAQSGLEAGRFSVVLANEFFDALPIHRFKRTDRGWREVVIDLETSGRHAPNCPLRFALSPVQTVSQKVYLTDKILQEITSNVDTIDSVEISPDSAAVVDSIADHVTKFGGCALIIDYGHAGDQASKDTLRAFSQHKQVNVLENVGKCDVTADVNFAFLKYIASKKATVLGPISQVEFLQNMGLKTRYDILMKNAKNDQTRSYLERCYHVLTSSEEMGERFKVMAIFPLSMRPIFAMHRPAGF